MSLDLRPFDALMAQIESATSGTGMAPIALDQADSLAEEWRRNISSAGLIRTGAYYNSIRTGLVRPRRASVTARVLTDLRYPEVLEVGSRYVRGSFVAFEAFDEREDDMVDGVARAIAAAIR